MKRRRPSQDKNQTSTDISLDDILSFLQNNDLTAADLLALESEVHRFYSLKANLLVQYFPCELWTTIFNQVPLDDACQEDGIHFWLSARTVSKSWHVAINKMDWSDVAHGSRAKTEWVAFWFPHLLDLFRCSGVLLGGGHIDVSVLTNVKELYTSCSSIKRSQIEKYSTLTQLTCLHLASDDLPQQVIHKLTNLEELEIKGCRKIQDISPLTKLRSLTLNSQLEQTNIENLTNLTQIYSSYPGFFKMGRGRAPYMGGMYDGEWLNGRRHGIGVFKEKRHDYHLWDGEKMKVEPPNEYEGLWCDDKKHGHGVMKFRGGHIYDGNWVNDKMTGHGRCVFVNGDVYDGVWVDGKKQGHGTYVFADGTQYEGDWENNKVVTWDNGHKVVYHLNPCNKT